MSLRKVTVTELRSRLDPMAVHFSEEARRYGLEPQFKVGRQYAAMVRYDDQIALWLISEQDAQRIVAAAGSQGSRPTIDLPEPTKGVSPAGWDSGMVFG